MKSVVGVFSAPHPHWVGNGFPVRSLFSYDDHGRQLSPFLLLDYAGPCDFAPSDTPRGVGQHPHRGFETVTLVYKGEVAHRDSTGEGGVIGPGDVQWMTAAAGILHEEFHSPDFTRSGGALEMVQLWVNLPARDKMSAPRYQAIVDRDIPTVPLAEARGEVRVIAGDFGGRQGPARTVTPMHVWDLRLKAGGRSEFTLPAGWSAALAVLHGEIGVNDGTTAMEAELAILGREGEKVVIEARTDAVVLLLSGEPIEEPVVGHGPFVMNSEEEIVQAIKDFNSGNFGQI